MQSQAERGKVAKLLYKSHGPLVVVEVLEKGAYNLCHEDRSNGAMWKHLAEDMFLLPKALHPCEPFDSMDFRYMNFDRALQLHPLRDALGIDAYNSCHLGPNGSTVTIMTAPEEDAAPHKFQSIAKLSRLAASLPPLDRASMPCALTRDEPPAAGPHQPTDLALAILDSRDKLFFIAYAPAGTLQKRWFPVQPNLDACAEVASTCDFASTGRYVVDFFAKFLRDKYRSDPDSRWWPEWHKFCHMDGGEMELGLRIEFAPNRKPDLYKYTTYSNVVDLCDGDVTLLGPFDFKMPLVDVRGTVSQ